MEVVVLVPFAGQLSSAKGFKKGGFPLPLEPGGLDRPTTDHLPALCEIGLCRISSSNAFLAARVVRGERRLEEFRTSLLKTHQYSFKKNCLEPYGALAYLGHMLKRKASNAAFLNGPWSFIYFQLFMKLLFNSDHFGFIWLWLWLKSRGAIHTAPFKGTIIASRPSGSRSISTTIDSD